MTRPDPFAVRDLLGPRAELTHRAVTGEHGIALPPLCDHHIHSAGLALARLAEGGIASALDLGADPVDLARRPAHAFPRLAYAGAFLTAPGGYPADEPWIDSTLVREVSGHAGVGVRGGAETAVDDQATFGASVIKVALDATGPVFDLDALTAIVQRARTRGLPVVAHVDGDGMTRLALDAGVDALAHAPFGEDLDDATIADAARAGQIWISTLAIHDGEAAERAARHLAAFAAAGGRVLYGTDGGAGESPDGVSVAELTALEAAGIRGPALIEAMTDPWPIAEAPSGVATFVPGEPAAPDRVAAWLTGARVVPTEELVHDER